MGIAALVEEDTGVRRAVPFTGALRRGEAGLLVKWLPHRPAARGTAGSSPRRDDFFGSRGEASGDAFRSQCRGICVRGEEKGFDRATRFQYLVHPSHLVFPTNGVGFEVFHHGEVP